MPNDQSEYKFLDDLKLALKNYGDINSEIDTLKLKSEGLKDKIQTWFEFYNINEFETTDITENTLWRLTITNSTRKTVNHDYLESVLSPEILNKVYKISPIKTFKCSKVKSRKKKPANCKIDLPEGVLN